jgi:hypothetical protein
MDPESTTLAIMPFGTTIISKLAAISIILTVGFLAIIINGTNPEDRYYLFIILSLFSMYYYDKYMIKNFYHSPLNDKIEALEEKLADLEEENQYLVSMDNMRQEEWEKLMRTQSKACSKIRIEFEKKYKKYNKLLKNLERAL